MSALGVEEIILRELAAFAGAFGFKIDVRQLQRFACSICEQISKNGNTLSQDILLTRKQCASLLGVSVPTLDKYIRKEALPFRVKNPRAKQRVHYIFLERDVLKWAQSHLSGFQRRRGPK